MGRTITITGATGLIGSPLCRKLLRRGDRLRILSRSTAKAAAAFPEAEIITWDAIAEAPPARLVQGSDAVIHLAGESVAGGRWSKARREAIRDSRVIGTRNLVSCLVKCDPPPRTFLCGSAIGYYGSRADEELDEDSLPGEEGFLTQLTRRWEGEVESAIRKGMRTVLLRTGLVLADGGALAKMLPPFRLGLGGRMGNGRQWMSWIHLKDEVDAILFALDHMTLEGPVNLTAPHPVTNREFTTTLANTLKRPALLPVPAFALRILVGQMSEELLLAGQRVYPKCLQQNGFQFRYPELSNALDALL